MAKNITIAGMEFNSNFFYTYMKKNFGESFAHSSLSFEKEFSEGKKFEELIHEFTSDENCAYYKKLENGSQEDLALLKTRYEEIAMYLERICYVPKERIQIDDEEFTPCIDDFVPFFKGAVRPYRTKKEINDAKINGQLTGAPYETEPLTEKIQQLFQIVSGKIAADKKAYNLKKGNNEAYSYALKYEKIGIPEIININAEVNRGSGIHIGFKSTDNDILSAPFKPCPKELVPIEMQKLLHKYNNEWAQEIEETVNTFQKEAQKNARIKAICEREAKFHIEFERIHPFEDGNGRTGRIIMNAHLVANELAPILITPEMREIYIKCIDDNDYKTLGQYIFMLSSVSLTEMISYYRRVRGIDPNELTISKKYSVTNVCKRSDLEKKETSEPDQKEPAKRYTKVKR